MEEQLYAIADYVPPENHCWVIPRKPYKIIYTDNDGVRSFDIIEEEGEIIHCLTRGCGFLRGEEWTIVKESDLTPEQRRMAGLPTEDTTIAELRERIEALEARVPVEEKREWPDMGDRIYYLDETGRVRAGVWGKGSGHRARDAFLGLYRTREQAERRSKQVRMFIEELNIGRAVRIKNGSDWILP